VTAVLASGGGTNLQALIDAAAEPGFPTRIGLVLSNVPGAYCLERARAAGIPTVTIDHRGFPDRDAFEAEVDVALREAGAEIVCLAGFMRILTETFVESWRDRILNVHPSLLPKYRGLDTHRRVLEAGDDLHGCTVHYVRPALDDGPAIIQAEVPVLPGDSPDVLRQRVLTREHVAFPTALALVASGRVTVTGDVALIDGAAGPMRLSWEAVEGMLE
jgi:phosphoribosylglycinamide formyltransferase-1